DQAALQDIRGWQAGEKNELVGRFLDPWRAAQISTFVGQFRPRELLRLLQELADRLSTQSAETWPEGRTRAPGIIDVLRMSMLRRPRSEQAAEAVSAVIERYTAVN